MTKGVLGHRKSVCIVTNELYPFAPGGIGRLVSNWILQNAELFYPVDLHLLFPEQLAASRDVIEGTYGIYNITAHFCEENDLMLTSLGRLSLPFPKNNWDYLHAHSASYAYYCALIRLERQGVNFDVIEFPDFGGWGAIAIEAKRAGIALQNSELTVRLHSSFGVIVSIERYYHQPSGFCAGVLDLERFALRHADKVIAHTHSILKANYNFYKFAPNWFDNAVVETPPVFPDDGIEREPDYQEKPVNRFIFSSRLQPFKRPDIFIRAACLYYQECPGDESEALVVSYGWDREFIASLQAMVPDRFKEKIRFIFQATFQERQHLMSGAIIVIPSDFESYCLFAYESAMLNRRVLLRRDCLAFGAHEAWIDGENCLMFESSPEALAQTMRKALSWRPRSRIAAEASIPYWVGPPKPRLQPTKEVAPLTHRAILFRISDRQQFPKVVSLCKSLGDSRLTVSVTPDIQLDELKRALAHLDVQFVQSIYGDLHYGELWRFAGTLAEDLITFVNIDDAPDKFFLDAAFAVFTLRPEVDVVSCHEALIDFHSNQTRGLQLIVGEHACSGLAGSALVGRLFCVRRELVAQTPYRENARQFAFCDMFQDFAIQDRNICILPDIFNNVTISDLSYRDPRAIATKLADLAARSDRFWSTYGIPLGSDIPVAGALSMMRIKVSAGTFAQRVWPVINPVDWGEPVIFSPELGGLLVHPVDNEVVVARLNLPQFRKNRYKFFVEVENVSAENDGVLFAFVPAPAESFRGDLISSLIAMQQDSAVAPLPPNACKVLHYSPEKMDAQHTDLFLISRPLPGRSAHSCLAVVKAFGVVFY